MPGEILCTRRFLEAKSRAWCECAKNQSHYTGNFNAYASLHPERFSTVFFQVFDASAMLKSRLICLQFLLMSVNRILFNIY